MQHALLLLLLLIARCLSACTVVPSGVELGISAGELLSGVATFTIVGDFAPRKPFEPPICSIYSETNKVVEAGPKCRKEPPSQQHLF